jgi:hypothetical protein
LTGKKMAVAGVVIVMICVSAALTVSVVDARRPLDERVSRSFDATLARTPHRAASVSSHGCVKTRVGFYYCPVGVHARLNGRDLTVGYTLDLRGDLCWTAKTIPPFQPPDAALARLRLGPLDGCL